MAGKTKRMSTIKQLLRLRLQGVSNRQIYFLSFVMHGKYSIQK